MRTDEPVSAAALKTSNRLSDLLLSRAAMSTIGEVVIFVWQAGRPI